MAAYSRTRTVFNRILSEILPKHGLISQNTPPMRAQRIITQYQSSISFSTNLCPKCAQQDGLNQRDKYFSESERSKQTNSSKNSLLNGPPLESFMVNSKSTKVTYEDSENFGVPYLDKIEYDGNGRKVFFMTYGCQMNINDTEIAWSILLNNGFQRASIEEEADVILIMTCSIRESAETKIWNLLNRLKKLGRRRQSKIPLKIGILGCMAERLKSKIIEEKKMVDIVCGPDAYRDLPRMLALTKSKQKSVNVLLSLEETYADVMPVSLNQDSASAFVSITRGCNNMCSYCIVPFTRGRERSRPMTSILEEVKMLSDQGIKQVTLLGQNVNSYCDESETSSFGTFDKDRETQLSKGFKTIYKPKRGGWRFSDLLDKVSLVDPEMRIRFTSPHPKDFPDEVLYLMKERRNICNRIHLPAQSGNNEVLERMRRGYTREAYLELVYHIRDIIPDVAFSSDFIAGFCGETDEAHQDTVTLIQEVKYNFVYCYPYSMRQKTHASHRLEDDVPQDVKSKRHMELAKVFREEALKINQNQVGQHQVILVEGPSKRSSADLTGRTEGETKVIIPAIAIPCDIGSVEQKKISRGDYVIVKITSASSQVLHGVPLHHTTLTSNTIRQLNEQERQDDDLAFIQ